MYCLSVAYWIFAVVLACFGVCWAYVLVQSGMLLAPLQSYVRAKYRARYQKEIDDQFWWHPVWGCFRCCSGQMAFWGYLFLFPLAHYNPLSHLGFAAITIILSIIIQKWSQ